ncbi:hypothetical protein BIW11_07322 [Tropilaelaps mercedesae]|uniref:Uncharacterized protein n=1 Tax=Tropilaelaps mercedesae TaxID=418985 RepID=A0A1V9XUF1_9ACAR|nr:hypothetical protein BIW11_07322 [Tropilaelaps mercedesae]
MWGDAAAMLPFWPVALALLSGLARAYYYDEDLGQLPQSLSLRSIVRNEAYMQKVMTTNAICRLRYLNRKASGGSLKCVVWPARLAQMSDMNVIVTFLI